MELPFLDRSEELTRLERLLEGKAGTLAVVYGRRRLGKSRLIHQATPSRRTVLYVGDDREPAFIVCLKLPGVSKNQRRLCPVRFNGW